ncbi:MAG: YhjD/YihY/BrkB family envelope integrity protein [Gammaproteobacteria bacterium]
MTVNRNRIAEALFAQPRDEPRAKARWRAVVQIVWLLVRDTFDGRLDRHARGLVYSTLIAIVPVLAFAIIGLKAIGERALLAPALYNLLAPLGPGGRELADKLLIVVGNLQIGVLSIFSIVVLVFAVVMLLFKIESGLDAAWQVTDARINLPRSLQYFGLLIVGPMFLFVAFGVTATLTSHSVLTRLAIIGAALPVIGKILSYVIAIVAFTLINLITPNVRVRFRAALAAGIAGGLAWNAVGQLFAFLAARSTGLSAIYSGLAIVILFLSWLYVSWLILLLGGRLGFYVQNPSWRRPVEELRPLVPASAEASALDIMLIAAERFKTGGRPFGLGEFVGRLGVPGIRLEPVLGHLLRARLLHETGRRSYVLARAPGAITVAQVIDAVRGETEAGMGEGLTELLDRAHAARIEAFAGTTLADLAGDAPEAVPAGEEDESARRAKAQD